MDGRDGKSGRKTPGSREERLKAALKANLARRKAQSCARQASDEAAQDNDDNED